MKLIKIGSVLSLVAAITAGNAFADDYSAKKEGNEQGRVLGIQESAAGAQKISAEQAIENWKQKPKATAQELISKYGQPQEVTSQRLVWHNNGPWLETELVNEEIEHNFPMPHKDMLKQTVSLKVPADKLNELGQFDGSVIVDRTSGEIAARCDKEPMNLLALNLANDIITGKKSVDEARDFYAKTAMAFMKGQKDAYTQELQFQPMRAAAAAPDEPSPIIQEKAGTELENKQQK